MVEIDRIVYEVAEAMRDAVENNTSHFDGGPEVDWIMAARDFLAAAEANAKEQSEEE